MCQKHTQILLSPELKWWCSDQPSRLYPFTAPFTSRPLSHSQPQLGLTHIQRTEDLQGGLGNGFRKGVLQGVVKLELSPPCNSISLFFVSFSPSCPSQSFFSPSSPVVLTVLTHTHTPRIQLGQDALLDLSFAYMPPTSKATSLAPGPPPFGLEWRRQYLGKGHLLLAATPGLSGQMPTAREGAVAFAAWDDDEPWGPWTGNGTLWLPAVRPFQEGVYLATIHLPYLQGQATVKLAVQSEWRDRAPHQYRVDTEIMGIP